MLSYEKKNLLKLLKIERVRRRIRSEIERERLYEESKKVVTFDVRFAEKVNARCFFEVLTLSIHLFTKLTSGKDSKYIILISLVTKLNESMQ